MVKSTEHRDLAVIPDTGVQISCCLMTRFQFEILPIHLEYLREAAFPINLISDFSVLYQKIDGRFMKRKKKLIEASQQWLPLTRLAGMPSYAMALSHWRNQIETALKVFLRGQRVFTLLPTDRAKSFAKHLGAQPLALGVNVQPTFALCTNQRPEAELVSLEVTSRRLSQSLAKFCLPLLSTFTGLLTR